MLTVCSLPDILGSSKSFVARAKGETVVIVEDSQQAPGRCDNRVVTIVTHVLLGAIGAIFLYTLPLLERSTFSRQLSFSMSSSTSGPSRKSERLHQKSVAKRSQKKPLANRLQPVTPTRTSSSLASVVHVKFRKWQKLVDRHPLALFHARFWGKSMEDEEEEWRKAQPQIEGQPEDEDEGRYEDKGKGRAIDEDAGKGRAIDKDDNETMEEDELEGEATDDDDDDIPGCYPFSVGIEDITVWIRADYIRVYEALEDYYNKALKRSGRTPSAVVTGQPGIGLSRYFASSV